MVKKYKISSKCKKMVVNLWNMENNKKMVKLGKMLVTMGK